MNEQSPYEPESLDQVAPPVADEGTEDLTEYVTAAPMDAGAASEPDAEAALADDSDLIESPDPEPAPESVEDLAGPQPMVAPVLPNIEGAEIEYVRRKETADAMVAPVAALRRIPAGFVNREASGLLQLASIIKQLGGNVASLAKVLAEIEELLALPTPGNLEQFEAYTRRVLKLARRWVGMTPDVRDDKLLNQIDRLTGNRELMALFAGLILDEAKPAGIDKHEADAVAQQFRANGVSLENLSRLLAIVSQLTSLFRD